MRITKSKDGKKRMSVQVTFRAEVSSLALIVATSGKSPDWIVVNQADECRSWIAKLSRSSVYRMASDHFFVEGAVDIDFDADWSWLEAIEGRIEELFPEFGSAS